MATLAKMKGFMFQSVAQQIYLASNFQNQLSTVPPIQAKLILVCLSQYLGHGDRTGQVVEIYSSTT